MELALASQIPAREWRTETDADIATALDILQKRYDEAERAMQRGRRR